jgi:hypothetical protein
MILVSPVDIVRRERCCGSGAKRMGRIYGSACSRHSDAGTPVGVIARMLLVSTSYVSKALGRRRGTGETTARPQRCHVPPKLKAYHSAIRKRVTVSGAFSSAFDVPPGDFWLTLHNKARRHLRPDTAAVARLSASHSGIRCPQQPDLPPRFRGASRHPTPGIMMRFLAAVVCFVTVPARAQQLPVLRQAISRKPLSRPRSWNASVVGCGSVSESRSVRLNWQN